MTATTNPDAAQSASLPGRRLDPRISDEILAATLDLLAEEGYARLSMEAVAHRAGVHKPAVYRRWPSKLDLVVAAVRSQAAEAVDPDTGDLRADLVALLRDAASTAYRNPKVRAGLRLMVDAAVDEELASAVRDRVVGPRRAVARTILERGVVAGELRGDLDLDLVVDLLLGPLHTRVLVMHRPFPRADIEALVDLVLDGIAAG
jgi:AcrR family transcriptional regulator